MKIKTILLTLATLCSAIPSTTAFAASTTASQLQPHCTMGSHVYSNPCVMVSRTLGDGQPVVSDQIDLSLTKPLAGRTPIYAVVYAYRSRSSEGPSVAVSRGDETIMGDTFADKTVYFWITTHDGGRTWSKITTNETGTVGN